MSLFQLGPDRYPPHPLNRTETINPRTLAFFVGLVALGLPTVMIIGAFNTVWDTCFRDFISHYYYAPFLGSIFIGALTFIGTYMIVYQGEDRHGAEARLSTWAGIFAYCVAVFPTDGYGCDEPDFKARAMINFKTDTETGVLDLVKTPNVDGAPDLTLYFELFPHASTLHYTAAALLFGFLAWFALVVFTAVDADQRQPDGTLTQEKVIRNTLYYICGGIMVLAIVVMASYWALSALTDLDLSFWPRYHLTFWCEAAALWAFGLSWMVKGRFWNTALQDEEDEHRARQEGT